VLDGAQGTGGTQTPAAVDLDALADAVAAKVADRFAELARRRYLSIPHAAEYGDLSPDSIRSLLSSGKLTALRPVPGRVVIDRRELDALFASSTKGPRCGRGLYERQKSGDLEGSPET
jgi:hypothetical protein